MKANNKMNKSEQQRMKKNNIYKNKWTKMYIREQQWRIEENNKKSIEENKYRWGTSDAPTSLSS